MSGTLQRAHHRPPPSPALDRPLPCHLQRAAARHSQGAAVARALPGECSHPVALEGARRSTASPEAPLCPRGSTTLLHPGVSGPQAGYARRLEGEFQAEASSAAARPLSGGEQSAKEVMRAAFVGGWSEAAGPLNGFTPSKPSP